ncbi:hypothetical protein [Streptomyces sp. TP-A0356]|nr:hypothetical protein [Streptomyces sp. TP-A0356]
MSFRKIAPVKKSEKPAPRRPAARKAAPKKHERRRPVGHQG